MCTPMNLTISPDLNKRLAEELNDEMKSSVMPVTVIVGLETGFGFVGNLLIIYVFLLHYHKCNFKYFVLCLAFIDITSTMTTMPGEIVTQLFWYVYPVPRVCKIKSFFNVFTVSGSAFCLLIISIDRFLKICRPLKWQIKPKLALVLCFILLAVAFVFALPVAFLWGTHSYQEPYQGYNVTVTVCEKDANYMCTESPLVYTIFAETIITCVMLIMFVLYIFICRKILKTKDSVAGMSKHTGNGGYKIDSEGTLSAGMTSDDELTDPNCTKIVTLAPNSDNGRDKENVGTLGMTRQEDCNCTPKVTSKVDKIKKLPSNSNAAKIKRKTLIMFILTAIFIFTTILYLTLLNLIANDVLQSLSKSQKSAYFFFFRLYFINHVINPILYGLLDPHFRRILKQILRSIAKVFRDDGY